MRSVSFELIYTDIDMDHTNLANFQDITLAFWSRTHLNLNPSKWIFFLVITMLKNTQPPQTNSTAFLPFLKHRPVNTSDLRLNVWQDSQTVIISSIKGTDIVRENFSTPHFPWDSHHYNCNVVGVYTNAGALNPQWVVQAWIHYHNIPNTGKTLLGVAGREVFICLSLAAFKLNLTHNIQIICSAWKQRKVFFSFLYESGAVY